MLENLPFKPQQQHNLHFNQMQLLKSNFKAISVRNIERVAELVKNCEILLKVVLEKRAFFKYYYYYLKNTYHH